MQPWLNCGVAWAFATCLDILISQQHIITDVEYLYTNAQLIEEEKDESADA